MFRRTSLLFTGIAALAALAFTAPSASAATWTVSPANTAVSLTHSSNTVITAGSMNITCTAGGGSVTTGDGSSGVVFAGGSIAPTSCTDNVLDGTWTANVSLGSFSGGSYNASTGTTAGKVPVTLKASGSALGATCSFTASGTESFTYSNGGITFTGGALTLSNVSGSYCSLGGVANGSPGSMTGAFTVSPLVTIAAS